MTDPSGATPRPGDAPAAQESAGGERAAPADACAGDKPDGTDPPDLPENYEPI